MKNFTKERKYFLQCIEIVLWNQSETFSQWRQWDIVLCFEKVYYEEEKQSYFLDRGGAVARGQKEEKKNQWATFNNKDYVNEDAVYEQTSKKKLCENSVRRKK